MKKKITTPKNDCRPNPRVRVFGLSYRDDNEKDGEMSQGFTGGLRSKKRRGGGVSWETTTGYGNWEEDGVGVEDREYLEMTVVVTDEGVNKRKTRTLEVLVLVQKTQEIRERVRGDINYVTTHVLCVINPVNGKQV